MMAEQRDADGGQRDAIARAATARAVRGQRQADGHQHRDGGHVRARGGGEAKFPLAEDHRGELEEKSKKGVEHECLGFYFG